MIEHARELLYFYLGRWFSSCKPIRKGSPCPFARVLDGRQGFPNPTPCLPPTGKFEAQPVARGRHTNIIHVREINLRHSALRALAVSETPHRHAEGPEHAELLSCSDKPEKPALTARLPSTLVF